MKEKNKSIIANWSFKKTILFCGALALASAYYPDTSFGARIAFGGTSLMSSIFTPIGGLLALALYKKISSSRSNKKEKAVVLYNDTPCMSRFEEKKPSIYTSKNLGLATIPFAMIATTITTALCNRAFTLRDLSNKLAPAETAIAFSGTSVLYKSSPTSFYQYSSYIIKSESNSPYALIRTPLDSVPPEGIVVSLAEKDIPIGAFESAAKTGYYFAQASVIKNGSPESTSVSIQSLPKPMPNHVIEEFKKAGFVVTPKARN
jgi:hypothetical protein